MRYFGPVPNLKIDADDYMNSFIFKAWHPFPSDATKAKIDDYEMAVAHQLNRLITKYTSYWVLREIGQARSKRAIIMPPDLAAKYFSTDEGNSSTNPVDDNFRDAQKRGASATTCGIPETRKEREANTATGYGSDTIVSYDPRNYATFGRDGLGAQGPGSAPDEILLHELVHAMRDVNGQGDRCFGCPQGYKSYEEFVAVVITNVYSSEGGRPLRKNYNGFDPLTDSVLSTSQGFFTAYQEYLLPLRAAHQNLYSALKRATGIAFNPFTLM
jgi:hypothetical protein